MGDVTPRTEMSLEAAERELCGTVDRLGLEAGRDALPTVLAEYDRRGRDKWMATAEMVMGASELRRANDKLRDWERRAAEIDVELGRLREIEFAALVLAEHWRAASNGGADYVSRNAELLDRLAAVISLEDR